MREIYQILTGLETEAAGLLAARAPKEAELQALAQALAGMRSALSEEELTAYTDWDERFHRGLLELCGNRRLAAAGLRYRDQVQRAHVIALRLRPPSARSVAAHEELVRLLLTGDEAAARASHYAQRVRAERELVDAVERHGLTVL
jgi:DNA-binding GntR family transcriptional regulator